MPTFDKKRFRTDWDILNDPKSDDDLEKTYRSERLRETADQLEQSLKHKNGPLFYRDVLFELASRELSKTPRSADPGTGDVSDAV